MPRITVYFFLVIFLVGWSIFVLWIDCDFVLKRARDHAASEHPTALAIIKRSEIESPSGNWGGRFTLTYNHPFKVLYLYEVNGRKYAGEKFRHGMHAGGVESARVIKSRYPVGKTVAVRYNPADPADSVMVAGLQGADLLELLFMTPFNVVMVFGWWLVAAAIRGLARSRDWRIECPPPVTRLTDNDCTVRLRLAHPGPMVFTVCALFAGPMVLAPIVLQGSQGEITVAQMGIAWASLLALTVGLVVWQSKRIAAGRYDFVVHRLRGVLALPLAFRKKKEKQWPELGELALVNIRDIRVVSYQERDSEGDLVTYHEPVITYFGYARGEESVSLRFGTSDEHAKEIVRELRRELGLSTPERD